MPPNVRLRTYCYVEFLPKTQRVNLIIRKQINPNWGPFTKWLAFKLQKCEYHEIHERLRNHARLKETDRKANAADWLLNLRSSYKKTLLVQQYLKKDYTLKYFTAITFQILITIMITSDHTYYNLEHLGGRGEDVCNLMFTRFRKVCMIIENGANVAKH